ncbi:inositol-trisphosphate 3-kinase B-like [Artemia franciscana]|uniref:inositol-trisphosphate 3-kinase B-like n=1 Tax=Artemia franciscana TaxID=6661 RepID=UPI0032DA3106
MNEVESRKEVNKHLTLKLPSLVVSDYSENDQGHVTSWLIGHEPYFQNGLSVCDIASRYSLERSDSNSSLSTYALSETSTPDGEIKKESDFLTVSTNGRLRCLAADFIPDPDEEGRKLSNCSTCSTTSTQDIDTDRPDASGWKKVRSVVSWSPFIQTYKKQRYPWIQLAGHQGSFKAANERGTILKRLCPREERCFNLLMTDALRPFVPEYKGHVVAESGELYLALEDLLCQFSSPCVMDCKIGFRTYLEEELTRAQDRPKLRRDLFEKMVATDPEAPTQEEQNEQGVSKQSVSFRYMLWRETISSSSVLGFRIEGMRHLEGASTREFRIMKDPESIKNSFRKFTGNNTRIW